MTTVIKAASTLAAPADEKAAAVLLAGQAARECLAEARLSPDAVGVLINVGVYREHNTFEPAVGALVQKEAGINLDYLAHPVPGAAFSFDLMNGACGVLNAVQVAQAMFSTGSAERVLITAADVHPGGRAALDDGYPYADLGAALLLERSATSEGGFGPVRTAGSGSPSETAGYLPNAGYLPTAGMGAGGRTRITVRRDPGFAGQLLDLAADTTSGYARTEGLDLHRTLLVSSRPTADFAQRLADRLGLPQSRVLAPDSPGGGGGLPHTAAPILGYLRAVDQGLPEDVDQILFVAVGAGPSAACVSYRPQDR
ncbi:hypothetical protein [Kitasatospora sp. GP82]|uniref:hypothetical protein n=1 Tax=Kitasatospora sp. GP82 TaxID=3035089 RepID=UPI00247561EB|nr:hypothetical protein [Kitasatospora sp. GP82]MDH6125844.1 3-oxoacyl-[acyl-carrier-protein] synthase-3 [Kitasatospora sp. GP82]